MKRIKLVPVQFKMFGEMIGGIMSLIQGKKQKAASLGEFIPLSLSDTGL